MIANSHTIANGTNGKPRRMSSKSKASRQKVFLAAYVQCGTITHAAEAAGIHRSLHYLWLDEAGSDYPQRWDDAQQEALEVLEYAARERAIRGVPRLKFHKGELIMVPLLDGDGNPILDGDGNPILTPYVEYEYSDKLTELLLRANAPEKYRERSEQRLTGDVNFSGKAQVILDDDWYGNAETFAAVAADSNAN